MDLYGRPIGGFVLKRDTTLIHNLHRIRCSGDGFRPVYVARSPSTVFVASGYQFLLLDPRSHYSVESSAALASVAAFLFFFLLRFSLAFDPRALALHCHPRFLVRPHRWRIQQQRRIGQGNTRYDCTTRCPDG